jgi:PAS domain S-box-containing protein
LLRRPRAAPHPTPWRAETLRAQLGPLFDSLTLSHTAVAIIDFGKTDAPLLFVNSAFEGLTGFTAADAVGRSGRFLETEETRSATMDDLAEALRERRPVSLERLHRRKSGERFWNRLNATPLAGPDGELTLCFVTMEDVTPHYAHTEMAAELNEARDRARLTHAMTGAAGAWEWNVKDDRLYGDGRFAELYGLDPLTTASGLPTGAFFRPIHPEDLMRIRVAVAGIMQGADVFVRDFRVIGRDGDVRWVSARGSAERDADYRTLRFTGVLADITSQKHIEERLRIAQSAGSIGTFEYISGFGTVGVSDEFCRLLGLMPAEALPVRTVNSVLQPGEPPLIGGAKDVETYREFRIVRPDNGQHRWIARRGEHRREGPALGERFLGVIYDVTAAKEAEERLRQLTLTLEERVRERTQERDRVWNNSRDIFVVLGDDKRLRAASPAWTEVVGHPADQVLDTPLLDYIAADDRAAMAAALERAAVGEDLTSFEIRMVSALGELRWISWHTSAETNMTYAYGRDVTETKAQADALRQTENQLRQAQKMEAVGQLTGGIAHDFNNMLTGVIGGLAMVRRRLDEGRTADLDRYLDAAATSAERAATLTHRLLAFSRQQPLDPAAVDINVLVKSMADMLRHTLGERVALEVSVDEACWRARTDANQVESAILNLAINARDAMPDGGRLTIQTSNAHIDSVYVASNEGVAQGDYVLIAVSDTGVGMPADVAAKAFDPFFTTKPIGQGTGLGLSMIYGFVQQTGGHVKIRSQPDHGSTVLLYLPRDLSEREPVKSTAAAMELPRGAGQTVLVVEDDPSVRMLVVEVLGELGYAAIQAADGAAALPVLTSAAPINLMITDVGLPGLNGRQLAEIAREHRPALPILFLTGYAAGAAVRSEFLGEGMDIAYKPFALETLATAIRRMVQTSSVLK